MRNRLTMIFLTGAALLAGMPLPPLAARWALPATAVVLAAAVPERAEARRFGGGRAFGFRGSRGLFSRGFRSRGFGRSAFGRSYRRPYYGGFGFGMPFLGGFGLGMGFGLFRMFLIPLILFFVLRLFR